jgi:carbamoyl-phosphate synthase large subunit
MLRDGAGTLHLIEINPRFPAWIYLSHGVGRNLPAALLALMHGTARGDLTLAAPRPGVTFIRHARELIVRMEDLVSVSMSGSTLQRGTT